MNKRTIIIEEHGLIDNEPASFIAYIEGEKGMVVQSDTAHGALRELATSMEVLEKYKQKQK